MTTISHAVMGGLMVLPITNSPVAIAIGSFVGAAPDVLGFIEGLFDKEKRWSGLYKTLHNVKDWRNYVLPPMALHIIIDYFTHNKQKGGWKPWVWRLEVVFWTLLTGAILCLNIF